MKKKNLMGFKSAFLQTTILISKPKKNIFNKFANFLQILDATQSASFAQLLTHDFSEVCKVEGKNWKFIKTATWITKKHAWKPKAESFHKYVDFTANQ